MKQQCSVIFCGCFEYSPKNPGEGEQCFCFHRPEEHLSTCECGGKLYFRVCSFNWMWAALLCVELAVCALFALSV